MNKNQNSKYTSKMSFNMTENIIITLQKKPENRNQNEINEIY